MKNEIRRTFVISFILFFIGTQGFSQSSITETAQSIFYQLNQDTLINHQEFEHIKIDSLFKALSKVLESNLFTNDTLFISCLDSNMQIVVQYENSLLQSIHQANGIYKLFLKSLRYSGLNIESLADSLWMNKEIALFPYILKLVDNNYLNNRFQGLTNCEDISVFLNSIENDSLSFLIYYNLAINNMQIIKNCDVTYANFLYRIKNSKLEKKDSILVNEKAIFESELDTSNANRRFIYNQIFQNLPDSITIAFNERMVLLEDSLRTFFQVQKEIFKKYQDSVSNAFNFDELSQEDQLKYQLESDTTLWQNGHPYVLEGDDGTRFDILSNEEIFEHLVNIDFKKLYDTIHSEAQLNDNAIVIHLRKIFQLLGDRFLTGSFIPSSEQLEFLSSIVDIYSDYIKIDQQSDLGRESIIQIMRLWNMMPEKYYMWLDEGNDELYQFVLYYFNPIINESIVIELINRADEAESLGNIEKALRYLMVIKTVYTSANLEFAFMPEKRPFRSTAETERLSDLYVYPALKKHHILK